MSSIYQVFLFLFFYHTAFGQPSPRHLEEITYDKSRSKLMLFGGAELSDKTWKEPSMIYEWDGKKWNSIEAKGPTGRRGHGWIYDESRRETILIGGVSEGKVIKDSVLFDVWHWNGKNWKLMSTLCPVKEPEAVYDAVNERVLVYGDANNKTTLNYNLETAFELWEYKNESWNKLAGEGPDIRGSRMIAYDIERKKLVVPVFEENGMTTWEWTGDNWIKTSFKKNCPAYRTRFAFAYDPVEKASVLFGGLSADRKQLGDFWKWDGQQWKKIEAVDNPSTRNSAHFATGNNELFLYGGSVPKASQPGSIEVMNELWRWKKGMWKLMK